MTRQVPFQLYEERGVKKRGSHGDSEPRKLPKPEGPDEATLRPFTYEQFPLPLAKPSGASLQGNLPHCMRALPLRKTGRRGRKQASEQGRRPFTYFFLQVQKTPLQIIIIIIATPHFSSSAPLAKKQTNPDLVVQMESARSCFAAAGAHHQGTTSGCFRRWARSVGLFFSPLPPPESQFQGCVPFNTS